MSGWVEWKRDQLPLPDTLLVLGIVFLQKVNVVLPQIGVMQVEKIKEPLPILLPQKGVLSGQKLCGSPIGNSVGIGKHLGKTWNSILSRSRKSKMLVAENDIRRVE